MDSKEFSEYIKSMSKDADAVFMCISRQSSDIVPKQYKEFGPKLPVLGTLTTFDETSLSKNGKALLDGISSNVYATSIDTPENKKFVKSFQDKMGKKPGWLQRAAIRRVSG